MPCCSISYIRALCLFTLLIFTFANIEWVSINSIPDNTVHYLSLSFSSIDNLVVVGQSVNSGVVARSTDRGLSWAASTYSEGTFGPLLDVTSKTIYGTLYYLTVSEYGEVYVSTDEGASFSFAGLASGATSLSIGDSGMAFAAGGSSNEVYSASNSTGYETWTDISPTGVTPSGRFYDVSTLNGVDVIVVGQHGHVYYSDNSGASWTAGTSGTSQIVYCVDHGSSNLVAMAAGGASYVAKTVDGGATWSSISVYSSGTVTTRFHAIYMHTDLLAYVAGDNGEIYSTDDGGVSWSLEASTGFELFAIEQLTADVGAATVTGRVLVIVQGM